MREDVRLTGSVPAGAHRDEQTVKLFRRNPVLIQKY